MKFGIFIAVVAFFSISVTETYSQRHQRNRPLSAKDQIIMKLDSIDQLYFSKLRTRDRFEARRKLDAVAQLVDKLSDELRDKELALFEKERLLQKRESGIEERDRDRDRINDNDRGRNEGHNRKLDHVSPISLQEFDQLLNAVETTPFDKDKQKVVKTSAISNYFLVEQVVKLASKFSFDNDKLDVIESLYPKILDVEKNYLLYNCFTFSDAKNKLEKFIESNTPSR